MTANQQFWIGMVDKIAWPVAFLVAIIVALLMFKGSIGSLIDRLRSLRYGNFRAGTDVGAAQGIPEQQQKAPEAQLDHLGEIANVARSYKSVPKMAADFRALLESNKGAPITDKTTLDLVVVLALIATQRNFELVYSVIHGSQIRLLRRLLECPSGLPREQIAEHMHMLRTLFKDVFETTSDEQYMQWLFTNGLVTLSNNHVSLTPTGDDFLRWIHENRRTTERPY